MAEHNTLTPLRKLREARGIKQSDVAAYAGIDQPTYSKIENKDTQYVSKKDIQAICRFFGSAITELHIMFPDRYPDYAILPEHVNHKGEEISGNSRERQ